MIYVNNHSGRNTKTHAEGKPNKTRERLLVRQGLSVAAKKRKLFLERHYSTNRATTCFNRAKKRQLVYV